MSAQMIKQNSLEKTVSGVWVSPCAGGDFSYSDGNYEEQYLFDVFSAAADLSLDSPELIGAIQDWASRYHLSPARANLLESINFPKRARILELGCGCGAITRYLAEQAHRVTAVEGSLKRAEIARLRNRHGQHVEVICENFNDLEFPAQYFDAILFIGVLEYAGRFSGQNGISPERAVIQLLNKASAALKPGGMMVIAIENRTGLKYQFGALEDHLAIAGAGLDDYRGYEFTGIKTYDARQWRNILTECGLEGEFYYPFPDYKLPNLVIREAVPRQDAAYLSTQITSTDPISAWRMPQPEQQKWQTIIAENTLRQHANSFGIVVTREKIDPALVFKHTWCVYDNQSVNPRLRLNSNDQTDTKTNKNSSLTHKFNKVDQIDQSLLNRWIEAFTQAPQKQTLVSLARDVVKACERAGPNRHLLELSQIMLSTNDQRYSSTRFWELDRLIRPEQQLFNLLLEFCSMQAPLLAAGEGFHLVSVRQIIAEVFNSLGYSFHQLEPALTSFMQDFYAKSRTDGRCVHQQLATLISGFDQYSFGVVHSQLFFAEQPALFNEQDSLRQVHRQTNRPSHVEYKALNLRQRWLRFDPCDHQYGQQHYFFIDQINVLVDGDKQAIDILDIKPIRCHDLMQVGEAARVYQIAGDDPQIIFSLPDTLNCQSPSYNLHITLQWLGK